MKKAGFLFVLIALISLSCSNTSSSNSGQPGSTIPPAAGTGSNMTATSAGVPEHLTAQTFKLKVMDYDKNPKQWVFAGDKPCIVDFYADWCRPCRMIAPILEELAAEYKGRIDVYKVDTDDQKELASVFGIQSLPTVLFVPMQGNPSAQKGAMSKEAYKKIIDEFLLKK